MPGCPNPYSVYWAGDKGIVGMMEYGVGNPGIVSARHQNGEIVDSAIVVGIRGSVFTSTDKRFVCVNDSSIIQGYWNAVRSLNRTMLDSVPHTCRTFVNKDGSVVVARIDSVVVRYSGPNYEKQQKARFNGQVRSLLYDDSLSIFVACVEENGGNILTVMDKDMQKVVFRNNVDRDTRIIRLSPTRRYLLLSNDIVDTKSWKSVHVSGGDYNVPMEYGGFLFKDSIYACSTPDFGLYMLDLRNTDNRSYKNIRGRVVINELRNSAFVIDSADNVTFMKTDDWTGRSNIYIPYKIEADLSVTNGMTFNSDVDALCVKNSLGTLYLWYPLSSTVTAVSEESGDTVESVCGIAQALSIRCRNGSAQLVLNGEPDSHSIRVVDVLGRDVAFEMDNRTVRLSNCRPGYHLVRYHHNGRTVSIPLMVVEE